jgi:hypothetical protein
MRTSVQTIATEQPNEKWPPPLLEFCCHLPNWHAGCKNGQKYVYVTTKIVLIRTEIKVTWTSERRKMHRDVFKNL